MMIANIKVSVIMPAYNDERFINDSVKSVLKQTHPNLELIIVDDCSTDKTVEIIEAIQDSRVKIIKNSNNMGAAFSRNLALKHSIGQYIAFLDADDLWEIDKLEKQLMFMVSNGYSFTYTEYRVFDYSSKEIIGFYSGPNEINHRKFLRCNYVGCLTVMYKRDLFPNLQIPIQIKKRNDYALWLLLSKKTNCHLLKECLATYTKTGSGISSAKKRKLFHSHYSLFRILFNCSPFKALFLASQNVFFYFLKRRKYYKKTSSSFDRTE